MRCASPAFDAGSDSASGLIAMRRGFMSPFPLPAAELRPEMGQKLAESPIGAWIETQKQSALELLGQVAPHAGAWIETFLALSASPWDALRPARPPRRG